MFTGIVEELGTVVGIEPGARSVRLTVGCSSVLEDCRVGSSIAVNGVCLTVADHSDDRFTSDVMPETMARTGLGSLAARHKVNLERALKVGDRLGGHIVTGHIDDVGVVTSRRVDDNAVVVTISASPAVLRFIVFKGSVTVDGVSLTVANVHPGAFEVSLIPHSANVTTLGSLRTGNTVNVECDIIGKYVARLLGVADPAGGLTLELLREHGFV
ncbi:MAG: riboflavin synthase [Candidatus Riflebacteria bacterium]|nr:riboflavin synthase [Candidatus Riflebacteria bacterium]